MSLTGGSYRPRIPNQHQCRVCGDLFPATRIDARYCGPTCRQAISRSQRGLNTLAASVVATNAPLLLQKLSQVSPPATGGAEVKPRSPDRAPAASAVSQISAEKSVTAPKQKVNDAGLGKSVTVTDKSRAASRKSVGPRKSVTDLGRRANCKKSVTKTSRAGSSAQTKPLARSKPKPKGKKK